MKTISRFFMIVAASTALLVGCGTTRATFVVRERPVEPVYSRPAPPYEGAVWVGGEWEWRDGRYVYINGHYERPSNRVWIPGHWRETPGGYTWDRGHWKNV